MEMPVLSKTGQSSLVINLSEYFQILVEYFQILVEIQ